MHFSKLQTVSAYFKVVCGAYDLIPLVIDSLASLKAVFRSYEVSIQVM